LRERSRINEGEEKNRSRLISRRDLGCEEKRGRVWCGRGNERRKVAAKC